MPDKKLTPMMELFNEIDKYVQFTSKYKEKFIEKERQMVIDAWADGNKHPLMANPKMIVKQYYTQTYKS